MDTFAEIFLVFCLVLSMLYILLIIMLIAGWLSLKGDERLGPVHELRVSILIPARNEEKNIRDCLRSIASQHYDMSNAEIIVIDDSSTDKTAEIIKQQQKELGHVRIKLIELSKLGRQGKKAALSEGVKVASEEFIITTDADTTRPNRWLETIERFYNVHKPKMIIGPVAYHKERNWFEKMQSIEFAGLVATAGGAAGAGMPMLCNGANLAFDKQAFQAARGYSGNEDIASGDDVMLMTRISRMFPGRVKFLKSWDAIVYTRACRTLRQFMNQRTRWASKNRRAYNTPSLAAGIIVLCMNFAIIASIILALFSRQMLWVSAILFALKCIIDFLFLFLAASFFEKRRFLFLFIPQQLLYMLYVCVTGVLAVFGGYEWKGRTHR